MKPVWQVIIEVLHEETVTKPMKRRAAPVIAHLLELRYRLVCNHEESRLLPRARQRPEVGAKIKCETCSRVAREVMACG